MTCRDAEPLLHARLDSELDMAGSASIDQHLSECRACAAQYEALETLHEEIVAADLAYPPPRWNKARSPVCERKSRYFPSGVDRGVSTSWRVLPLASPS
jgi:predicted anti-sigma-YlaC factor YlaD